MNFSTRINRFRIAILRMMSSEPLHRDTGKTLSEVIAQHPIELAYDAHALMHIVPVGRVCFGLKGDALTDYVRRSVRAMLESGGVPVTHVAGNGYDYTYEPKYGSTISLRASSRSGLRFPMIRLCLPVRVHGSQGPIPSFRNG